MTNLPEHIIWQALSGAQAIHACGNDNVRRFASGFSPIVGFRDPHNPDFSTLNTLCQSGEYFYTDIWHGPLPEGWHLQAESTMFKMCWHGVPPEPDPDLNAIALGPEHAEVALALAIQTRPGPFGPRTLELGDYFGCIEDGRLIAMAGERLFSEGWREISGVCTLPEFQGRGLARRLMLKLIDRELARGERPFLHVMRDNHNARRLYAQMGFRDALETVVRVIVRD
jgi:GNAT superfamily N-acetyltransferase